MFPRNLASEKVLLTSVLHAASSLEYHPVIKRGAQTLKTHLCVLTWRNHRLGKGDSCCSLSLTFRRDGPALRPR